MHNTIIRQQTQAQMHRKLSENVSWLTVQIMLNLQTRTLYWPFKIKLGLSSSDNSHSLPMPENLL